MAPSDWSLRSTKQLGGYFLGIYRTHTLLLLLYSAIDPSVRNPPFSPFMRPRSHDPLSQPRLADFRRYYSHSRHTGNPDTGSDPGDPSNAGALERKHPCKHDLHGSYPE